MFRGAECWPSCGEFASWGENAGESGPQHAADAIHVYTLNALLALQCHGKKREREKGGKRGERKVEMDYGASN